MATRVLVVGVGGIGGTLIGSVSGRSSEDFEVVGLSRRAGVVEAARAGALTLRDGGVERRFSAVVVDRLTDQDGPFDLVLLATQPPEVEQATAQVAPWLAENGDVVVLQNGLCEDRVATIVGRERVLGAVVAWGASAPAPGVFERTSRGGFTIGRLDGTRDPRLDRLGTLLGAVGPVEVTLDLAGARWTKLALNCAVSTLGTIGGERLGRLTPHRFVRRLGLHLMSEAVEVARAQGISLGRVAGTLDLDWVALTGSERSLRVGSPALVAKHALLLAVGARYRRMRSSMLAAIEQGRPPAIDFLNGEVVCRGEALGVPTPVNAAAVDVVRAIARGELESGLPTLRRLADDVGLGGGSLRRDDSCDVRMA